MTEKDSSEKQPEHMPHKQEGSHKPRAPQQTHNMLLRSTQVYGVMLLISLAIIGYEHKNIQTIVNVFVAQDIWHYWLSIGCVGSMISLTVGHIFRLVFSSYRQHRALVLHSLGGVSLPGTIYLALLAAISEELLFRGALQPYLGVFMTSLTVTLLQVSPDFRLTAWSLFIGINSMMLGLLFGYTKSLIPGMMIQFILNLSCLLPKHFIRSDFTPKKIK